MVQGFIQQQDALLTAINMRCRPPSINTNKLLFHQNMRTFGGGTPARNLAFAGAFLSAARDLIVANDEIVVAGFTEILNYNAARAQLALLPRLLFGLLNEPLYLIVVACGRTALAQNGPEFIGIAVKQPNLVHSFGRILINASGQNVQLHHDIYNGDFDNWCQNLPMETTTLDYRGVVYVVVTVENKRIAVGFIHNLYTNENARFSVRAQIRNMMTLMLNNPAMLQHPDNLRACYIGGDFNLDPARVGTDITNIAVPYWAPNHPTSSGGHFFDYWYAPINNPPLLGGLPIADVYYGTQTPPGQGDGLSDHAAILLRIV